MSNLTTVNGHLTVSQIDRLTNQPMSFRHSLPPAQRRYHMSEVSAVSDSPRAPIAPSLPPCGDFSSTCLQPQPTHPTTNLPPPQPRTLTSTRTKTTNHGARHQTPQNPTPALRMPNMHGQPHLLTVPRQQPDLDVRAPDQHVQALPQRMGGVADRDERFRAAYRVPGV